MFLSGTSLLILAICSLALFILYSKRHKDGNNGKVLPGPRGIPFLGNIFQVGRLRHLKFSEWAKEFGDLYKVQLGMTNFLIVSDPTMVKEIFSQDPALQGRLDFKLLDIIPDGNVHGLANTEGEHWEQVRRFTIRHLRDFGFGKGSMEPLIMEEVKDLLDWIQSQKGNPISDVQERFSLCVVNALWRIISGKRYKQDDRALLKISGDVAKSFNDAAILGLMPILASIFPEWSGHLKLRRAFDKMLEFFYETLGEHKATYSDDYSRDFIDAFLKEIKETKDPKSAFYKQFGEDQLIGSITDLFFAGSDTTSATLAWTLKYLSNEPDKQRKLQTEIKAVVGDSRPCCLADRPLMPYTEALIAEVLRQSSIVPSGLTHRAMATREFRGYTIPKDTVIMHNAYHIHFNPQIWGDPEEFRPERFLNEDETCFKKNEALMPFSIGRRACIGESLARDTLFLFITNIFQKFSIQFDDKDRLPDMSPKDGFVLHPKPFRIRANERI